MNDAMSQTDINFAYKIRHALNEQAEKLPKSTIDRLASARKSALSKKKKDAPVQVLISQHAVAGQAGFLYEQPLSWLGRIGVIAPLVLGATIFVGLYQSAQQQRISDLADIDAAVLADELPLSAYLDHGFNAYLSKRVD